MFFKLTAKTLFYLLTLGLSLPLLASDKPEALSVVCEEVTALFQPQDNPALSAEDKALLRLPGDLRWAGFFLANLERICGQRMDAEFLAIATTFKAKLIEFGQPFSDSRYPVAGPMADACRRLVGWQTAYDSGRRAHATRQKMLADFNFQKEKDRLFARMKRLEGLALQIFSLGLEPEFVITFAKFLVQKFLTIKNQLEKICRAGLAPDKLIIFEPALLLLSAPAVQIPLKLMEQLKSKLGIDLLAHPEDSGPVADADGFLLIDAS